VSQNARPKNLDPDTIYWFFANLGRLMFKVTAFTRLVTRGLLHPQKWM
jgi:hypothetical protein